jgi:hypothetical protein
VGTPPRNGDVCRLDAVVRDDPVDADICTCAATGRGAVNTSSAADKTNFTSDPFSPDAKLDEEGAGVCSRSRR